MPTIESSYKDLCKLVGKKLDLKKLEREFISYVKGEVDEIDGDTLKFDMADTNRPDLWSTEGIARELKGYLSLDKGIPKYKAKKSSFKIKVDPKLKNIRPFIAAAVIKNIKVTEDLLIQMIQLQEKVTDTFGSKRKTAAIGLYDFDMITPPLHYKAADPEKEKFIPLEFKEPLTLRKILSKHPKGREFKHLLEDFKEYPIWLDVNNQVLSMPPIINSEETKVDEKAKNLFIDVTGTDLKACQEALNILITSLADRNGKIYQVKIDNKFYPDLKERKLKINKNYANKILGLNLTENNIKELLPKMGLGYSKGYALIPSYRTDIISEIDLVEELAIAYGYENFEPEIPNVSTIANENEFEKFKNKICNILTNLKLIETNTYNLTNKNNQTKNMNIKMNLVEVENALNEDYNVLRSWMTPSLLEVLKNNKQYEYPQKIFEAGNVFTPKEKTRLGVLLAGSKITFTDIKQILDVIFSALDIEYETKEIEHDSFIPGRVGRISYKGKNIAYLGEISPKVLENFSLEVPIAALELNLTELFKLK